MELGFKYPDLWDTEFLRTFETDGKSRAIYAVEREFAAQAINTGNRTASLEKLSSIRNRFYELSVDSNRQRAGLAFESVLNDLFALSGLKPRLPFRVTGEQIDGSFDLDGEIYLLEAKWEKAALDHQPLLVFRGKIEGKSAFTRGLFISLNGWTKDAKIAIKTGKQPLFFGMDGYDLGIVLEGKVPLQDLLRAKQRRLAEEGEMFFSVSSTVPHFQPTPSPNRCIIPLESTERGVYGVDDSAHPAGAFRDHPSRPV